VFWLFVLLVVWLVGLVCLVFVKVFWNIFFIRGDLRKRVLVPHLLAGLFKHVLSFS